MNHLICAFGISFRKFLGFTVHRRRIGLDLAKAKAIQAVKPVMTCKQLKSFMGRVSYARISITALPKLPEPFHKLLKKNSQFRWDEEQHKAF